MQAAASLFMNRPGHRGAAASISGDSLSSEVVSTSSHDPLLSSSRQRPSSASRAAAPPPPLFASTSTDSPLLTLNTLDPTERAALIRQSRKINKVLGATPHIVAEAAAAAPRLQHQHQHQHQRRGTVAGPDTDFHSPNAVHPSTSGAGAGAGARLSRARVSKSLIVSVPDPSQFATPKAPFLRIATNSNTPRLPGSPPTVRRRASDTSISSSATGASFVFAPPSPVPGTRQQLSSPSYSRPSQDSFYSFHSRDSHMSPSADPPVFDPHASLTTIQSLDSSLSLSLASPVFSPRTTEELSSLQRQQTRARLAKLQRLMGENVPSELVLRTAGRPSTGSRRRLSIDLPPLAKNNSGRAERAKHKRAKSMWKKDSKDDAGFESAPEPADRLRPSKGGKKGSGSDGPYSRSSEDTGAAGVLQPPLTEKQKALNVKRAMKMAQVFGVPPPQDLYQIQSSSPTLSLDTRSLSRQSLVSLASLAYLLDHDRDSLYDMLANAPELAEEGEDEGPVEWPYERKGTEGEGEVGTVDPQDKTTFENALKRRGSAKSKSSPSSGRGSPIPIPIPISIPSTSTRTNNTNMSASSPLGGSRAGSRSDVNLTLTATSENSPVSGSSLSRSGSLRRAKSKERIDGVAKLRKERPPPLPVPSSPSAWRTEAGSSGSGSGVDADFTARRRRANKLSRFFGVGYQDLFHTMLFGIPGSPTATGASNDEGAVAPAAPLALASGEEARPRRSGGGTVVVVTDGGKEIDLRKSTADWNAAVDQQDLKAMMGRLRSLRV